MYPFIQVAGVKDIEEATMLMDEGVDFIGFPLRLDVHREDIGEQQAAEIAGHIGKSRCVLITYETRPDELSAMCDDLGVRILQVHGIIGIDRLAQFRRKRPDIYLIKSLIIGDEKGQGPEEALDLYGRLADAFIADTYDPSTGACGATGKTHNWDITRMLVKRAKRPVILAGGLNPENVGEGIIHVRPAGVDAHTGVEDTSGCKDRLLVRRFVAAAREAFKEAIGKRTIV